VIFGLSNKERYSLAMRAQGVGLEVLYMQATMGYGNTLRAREAEENIVGLRAGACRYWVIYTPLPNQYLTNIYRCLPCLAHLHLAYYGSGMHNSMYYVKYKA
jgi:hypothetical protein